LLPAALGATFKNTNQEVGFMVKKALFVRLEAKAGKEKELEEFLNGKSLPKRVVIFAFGSIILISTGKNHSLKMSE
jgi:hypothetical protein